MGKDSAANIERRTLNIEFQTEPSAFGVGCSTFDVRCLLRSWILNT